MYNLRLGYAYVFFEIEPQNMLIEISASLTSIVTIRNPLKNPCSTTKLTSK